MATIDFRTLTPGLLSANAGFADYTQIGLDMDNGTDGLHVDSTNGLRNGDNFSSHAAIASGLTAGGYVGFLLNGNPNYYLSDNETTRLYLNQSDGTPAYELVVRAPGGVFDRVVFQRWDGAAFASFSSSFGASWTGPRYNTAVNGDENIGFILNANGELELYIDNVLQFTSAADASPLDTTGDPSIRIGANTANTVSVQGLTDELTASFSVTADLELATGTFAAGTLPYTVDGDVDPVTKDGLVHFAVIPAADLAAVLAQTPTSFVADVAAETVQGGVMSGAVGVADTGVTTLFDERDATGLAPATTYHLVAVQTLSGQESTTVADLASFTTPSLSGTLGAYSFDDSAVHLAVADAASEGATIDPTVATRLADGVRKLHGYNLPEYGFRGQMGHHSSGGGVEQFVSDAIVTFRGGELRYPGGLNQQSFHWQSAVGPVGSRPAIQQFRYDPGTVVTFGLEEFRDFKNAMGMTCTYGLNIHTTQITTPYVETWDLPNFEEDAATVAASLKQLALWMLNNNFWREDEVHTYSDGNEYSRSFFNKSPKQIGNRCEIIHAAIREGYDEYNLANGTNYAPRFKAFLQEFDVFMDGTEDANPGPNSGKFGYRKLAADAGLARGMVAGRLYCNQIVPDAVNRAYAKHFSTDESLDQRLQSFNVLALNLDAADADIDCWLYEGDNPGEKTRIVYSGAITIPGGASTLTEYSLPFTNVQLAADKEYNLVFGTQSSLLQMHANEDPSATIEYENGTAPSEPYAPVNTQTARAFAAWFDTRGIARISEHINWLMGSGPGRADCDDAEWHDYADHYPNKDTDASPNPAYGIVSRLTSGFVPLISQVRAVKPNARLYFGEYGRINLNSTALGKHSVNGVNAAVTLAEFRIAFLHLQGLAGATQHALADLVHQPFGKDLEGGPNDGTRTPRMVGDMITRKLLDETPIAVETTAFSDHDTAINRIDGQVTNAHAFRNVEGTKLGVVAVNRSNQPINWVGTVPALAGQSLLSTHNYVAGQAGQDPDPDTTTTAGRAVFFGFDSEENAAETSVTAGAGGELTATLPPLSVSALLFSEVSDPIQSISSDDNISHVGVSDRIIAVDSGTIDAAVVVASGSVEFEDSAGTILPVPVTQNGTNLEFGVFDASTTNLRIENGIICRVTDGVSTWTRSFNILPAPGWAVIDLNDGGGSFNTAGQTGIVPANGDQLLYKTTADDGPVVTGAADGDSVGIVADLTTTLTGGSPLPQAVEAYHLVAATGVRAQEDLVIYGDLDIVSPTVTDNGDDTMDVSVDLPITGLDFTWVATTVVGVPTVVQLSAGQDSGDNAIPAAQRGIVSGIAAFGVQTILDDADLSSWAPGTYQVYGYLNSDVDDGDPALLGTIIISAVTANITAVVVVNKGTGTITFDADFALATLDADGVPQTNITEVVANREYTFTYVRENGPGTAHTLGVNLTWTASE